MLNSLLRPSFLIPFALVTPYMFIGRVGVTWFEVLLLGAFFIAITLKGTIPRSPLIIIFLILLLVGYFIAVINAEFNFNIPFKFGDLKIFYWQLLAIVGFYFGYRNYQDIVEIGRSRVFKLVLIVLGLFVGSYPFLGYEIRWFLMQNYYHPDIDMHDLRRLFSARFPGLGVNANTYAFMTLIMYYIALKSALEKKISWIYPLMALVIIIITGSKTVFGLALLLFANLFYFSRIRRTLKIKVFTGVVVFLSVFTTFIIVTDNGKNLQKNVVLINRMMLLSTNQQNMNQLNPLASRISIWKMGMARVELSPFAGIAFSPSPNSDKYSPVGFCCPHNEFIAYWTFTGFLGLLAYITLIAGLIIKNRRTPQAYFWIGLYVALCFQMFFDAAFQSTRFIPLMFIVIGLNLRELDIYQAQRRRVSRTGYVPHATK
jgi:hypothetical protein